MATSLGCEAAVRRWQRYALDVPVLVHTILVIGGERKELTFRGTFKDISKQGIGIQVGIDLRIGSELRVEFPPVFQGEPLVTSVIVRNRRDNNVYGLEFVGASSEDKRMQEILTAILTAIGQPRQGDVQDRVIAAPEFSEPTEMPAAVAKTADEEFWLDLVSTH